MDLPHRCFTLRIVCLLTVLQTSMLGWAAYRQSIVFDELGHLPAGLYHLTFHRFDLYAVNPPLIRTVAAFPVWFFGYNEDWRGYSARIADRSEFACGTSFILANPDFMDRWRIARWICIPFSVLGGLVCFRWARELYGRRAGLIAMSLWVFCPTILGTGTFILPDVGATSLGAACWYCFRRWLKEPKAATTLALGLITGLTQLSKFTWLSLYLLFPLVWGYSRLRVRKRSPMLTEFIHLLAAILLSVYVVNLVYGFEDSFKPLGQFSFSSGWLSGSADNELQGNVFNGTPLGHLPIPLPANFVLGLDHQKSLYERGAWSYLRGEHRHGGWWYYYLYAMSVKIPIGTLCLICMSLALVISQRRSEELYLLCPAMAVIVLVSSQTGINHHVRYVLPAFPFFFILAAGMFASSSEQSRLMISRISRLAISSTIVSSIWCYPHSGSFFNQLAGGPGSGWRHLDFSNVGWGQDVLFLKEWKQRNPDCQQLFVSSRWQLFLDSYGVDSAMPVASFQVNGRTEFPPGWYAIDVNALVSHSSHLTEFLRLVPEDRVGYTFMIYRLDVPLPLSPPSRE